MKQPNVHFVLAVLNFEAVLARTKARPLVMSRICFVLTSYSVCYRYVDRFFVGFRSALLNTW